MNKKIKILEITILITIIISLIVVSFFAINILNKKPSLSKSNEIENYSTTRTINYKTSISDSYIYKIPYTELINNKNSTFDKYVISTDNTITTYKETIKIYYSNISEKQETIIKNFCNTYDIIELKYRFKCSYNNSSLIIENQYNIDQIYTDYIKNNHNIKINIPIKRNSRLNEYLDYLNKNKISYEEITIIE